MLREATIHDFPEFFALYRQLHSEKVINENVFYKHLQHIVQQDHIKIIGIEIDHKKVASCMVAKFEELSYACQPFAIIENVITHSEFRGKGYGKAIVMNGIAIAQQWNCYKVILETSTKDDWKLRFYESCGLQKGEKTAFIKRF